MRTLTSILSWYIILWHWQLYKKESDSYVLLAKNDVYNTVSYAPNKMKQYYNYRSKYCTLAALLKLRMKLEYNEDCRMEAEDVHADHINNEA